MYVTSSLVVGSSTAQKDSAQKKKTTARQKEIDDVLRSLELDASANGTAT